MAVFGYFFAEAKSVVTKMKKMLLEWEFWVDFWLWNACKCLRIGELYVFT